MVGSTRRLACDDICGTELTCGFEVEDLIAWEARRQVKKYSLNKIYFFTIKLVKLIL